MTGTLYFCMQRIYVIWLQHGPFAFGGGDPCECGGEGAVKCDVSVQGLNYNGQIQKQLDQPECRLLCYSVGVKGDFL